MKTKGQKLVLFHYIEIMIASALAVMAGLLCAKFPADSTVIIAGTIALLFLEGYLATKILKKTIYWYESLLDAVPFPLSITDNKMNWTFINKAVEGMLGKKRSELIGLHCSNWGADICKTCKCGIDCLRKGQNETVFEQANMHFQVNTSYLLDKKQRPTGHIEVVQDITALYRFRASLDLVQKINTLCASVAGTADEIASEAKLLAQGSSEQAASVSELTSSIAEMSNQIDVNAQQATQAADLAKIIQTDAEKESTQMEKMMKAVQEISEAGQSIEKIIGVIDGIAFQTNILALNAAVEAARAGQHGKGFAVVAEEVRSLAARSAEAARNTHQLIANSIEKSTMGANISNEAVAALQTIIERIKESSAIIMGISESAHKQNENVKHIRSEIEHVSSVVQQNNSTAQKSADASNGLNDEMSTLKNLLDGFNNEIA